ncbi:hypothetical protein QUB80_08895 [Chlorogloeopsis sp. ULAP01]|nr:hypothetical protein [Chlorogloeopsis sp. ULAP01]
MLELAQIVGVSDRVACAKCVSEAPLKEAHSHQCGRIIANYSYLSQSSRLI